MSNYWRSRKLERAIKIVGSLSQLADAIDVSPQVVQNWRSRGRVPPERCADVERATGGTVSRHDLRPDIFGPAPAPAERAA